MLHTAYRFRFWLDDDRVQCKSDELIFPLNRSFPSFETVYKKLSQSMIFLRCLKDLVKLAHIT